MHYEYNQLIAVEYGYFYIPPLPAADDSASTVTIIIPKGDTVDLYTLYAAGES
jgi:hypothetical protein